MKLTREQAQNHPCWCGRWDTLDDGEFIVLQQGMIVIELYRLSAGTDDLFVLSAHRSSQTEDVTEIGNMGNISEAVGANRYATSEAEYFTTYEAANQRRIAIMMQESHLQ